MSLPPAALARVLHHAHERLSENVRHRRVARAWNAQLRTPSVVERFANFALKQREVPIATR